MRINNNLMAMNTHRQLGINNTATSKSLEKLSSGFRINRAGDDAAGLAISEKMRGQIRGLTMASKNAQDGISLIQTAEGALTESHAILQRMRELAVQSANDTNVEIDRGEIQKEIDELAAELTRIADTTEFNTQNLLGGKFKAKFHVGANEGQNVDLAINDMSAQALKVTGNGEGKATYEISGTGTAPNGGNLNNVGIVEGEQTFDVVEIDNVTLGDSKIANYGLVNDKGEIVATSQDGKDYVLLDGAYKIKDLSAAEADSSGKISFDDKVVGGTVELSAASDGTISDIKATASIDVKGLETGKYEVAAFDGDKHLTDVNWYSSNSASGSIATVLLNSDNEVVAVSFSGSKTKFYAVDDVDLTGDASDLATNVIGDAEAIMTKGANFADGDKFEIKASGGIDVSTQETADKSITTINKAIETVSAERSKLGALQNRLEHTIKNLDNTSENLQAAESRIRDVDMAKEMMEFTKQNILQQAATAMLAQSNQLPTTVLQLLR